MNFNFGNLVSAEYLPYVVPACIVLATGLIVILLLLKNKVKGGKFKISKKPTSSQDSLMMGVSASDRRNSVRRDGPPVEVVISSPVFPNGDSQGYVLDRSTGGLRLALAVATAPGSTLQVRARHAPETTPWVTVIVRSCKPIEKHFELGCEFDKTPPWNVLLLFG